MTTFYHPVSDADTPLEEWSTSQGFGALYSPWGYHFGIDLNWGSLKNADKGEKIYMPVGGEIAQTLYSAPYGGPADQNNVAIAWVTTPDNENWTLKFGHLDVNASVGDINAGDEIGQLADISNAGMSSHLDLTVMEGHLLGELNSYSSSNFNNWAAPNAQGLTTAEVTTTFGTNVTYVDPQDWIDHYSEVYAAMSPSSSSGGMSFMVDQSETIDVGTITAGSENVYIDLSSNADIDLELWAGGEALVGFGTGAELDGSSKGSFFWNGVEITYSGYSGDGSGSGEEYISIDGVVPEDLEVKVTGFDAGGGSVEWMEIA
jgi:hypothetical protein